MIKSYWSRGFFKFFQTEMQLGGQYCVSQFPLDAWDAHSDFRATWYMCMKALMDEETQRRGVVWVIINTVEFQASPDHLQGMVNVLSRIPHRMLGGHYCYGNAAFRPYATGFQLFAGGSHRNHLRLHCGSKSDIDFELMTFGILTDFLPVVDHDRCNTVLHRELLTRWRSQEPHITAIPQNEPKEEDSNVMVSRRFDVLFGKSTMARKHTGTLRAQILVEMHFEAYESAGKFEKTGVAERIIRIIHESGGTFLERRRPGILESSRRYGSPKQGCTLVSPCKTQKSNIVLARRHSRHSHSRI
eukprot:Nitzschia sp. Nitz4//scaffold83_size84149//23721//24717//NITZ4_005168-RA/size84149-snap-gene-0.132-mRNA-1//-1//CDS//3329558929//9473//frame0